MKLTVKMVILVALLISILGGLPTGVWAAMQGFEGENAITCPDEEIAIVVSFVTPPSVALRLAYERGEIMPPNFTEGMSFVEYALKGHIRFRQQLALILTDDEFEIIHEFHTLVNGVEMRVRGGMVETIANMPEVSAVFPSELHEDGGEDEPVITDNISIVMLGDLLNDVSFWSVDGTATPSAEILNVNDLNTYVSEHNFTFSSFDISKYDESFFNERFLYFLPITKPNSPNEFEIEVTVGKDIIQVDVIHTMMGDDTALGQWLIILEIHRTLLGRDFSVFMATGLIPPPIPTVSGIPSVSSITLNSIPSAEFRIATPTIGDWQPTPIFTGLMPDTEYTFQARFASVGNIPASESSLPSEIIRTASEPPLEWTVTFDLNGGNIGGDASNIVISNVPDGTDVTLPPNPTRSGYTFNGWSPAGAYNNITSSRTITAQWTAIAELPTIVFSPGNATINNGNLSQTVNVMGTALGDISVNYDSSQVLGGITVSYSATDATITIVGVRPTTNVPAVTGDFDVYVTREGVTESFMVSINLTTTWTSPQTGNSGGGHGGGTTRPPRQQPTETVPHTQNEPAPNEVSEFLLNGMRVIVNDETTVTVSLEDFDFGEINTYRIVAIASDGTLAGGTFDTETSLFVFEAPSQGEFTIIYAADLIRLSLSLDSLVITDLAGNVPAQTMDVLPVVQAGRILLPVRFIAQALGANVDWTHATENAPLTVFITVDGETISMPIGEITPELTAVGMEIPAQIMGNRTMVPLRFVSEFFDAIVNWCEETRSIEIIRNCGFTPQDTYAIQYKFFRYQMVCPDDHSCPH
ncbi:MAG: stalk domain-containing protein [Defluviitaleaceae bacterium]|nr:stalk domain-containing protein [Defluviitaleaceae bacterium]